MNSIFRYANLYILFLGIIEVFASTLHIKEVDSLALLHSPHFFISSFDTLKNPNGFKRNNQKIYREILLFDFYHGIHESSTFEVLTANHKDSANAILQFDILDIYLDSNSKNDNNVYSRAALSVKGFDKKNEKTLFHLIGTDTSVSYHGRDEVLQNLMNSLNEIDSFFDKYSKESRIRTFQKYAEIKCNDLYTLNFVVLRDRMNNELNLVCNLIDYEITEIAKEKKFSIEKPYSSEVDFLLQSKSVDLLNDINVLPPKIAKRFLEKWIRYLVVLHNVEFLPPLDSLSIGRVFSSPHFENVDPMLIQIEEKPSIGSILAKVPGLSLANKPDRADDLMCDMLLLDVEKNKVLLRTKLFANNPGSIADEMYDAIGSINHETGEVKSCFD